ncbi:hypothetical protein HispidOSU_026012 [Sigmodon hispidus]
MACFSNSEKARDRLRVSGFSLRVSERQGQRLSASRRVSVHPRPSEMEAAAHAGPARRPDSPPHVPPTSPSRSVGPEPSCPSCQERPRGYDSERGFVAVCPPDAARQRPGTARQAMLQESRQGPRRHLDDVTPSDSGASACSLRMRDRTRLTRGNEGNLARSAFQLENSSLT